MSRTMFTVKQLSKLAGVTPRTLHHYDAIGLLKPSRIGDNGYRYYGEDSLLRLQQILFYRELDIPLEDIKRIMGRRDFDILGALQSHKDALHKQVDRLNTLIMTVEHTLDHLKGKTAMQEKDYFEGFSEEELEKYALEAEELYDPEAVQASMKKWKRFSAVEKTRLKQEGREIYRAMVAAMPQGPESRKAQDLVDCWRRHLENLWNPDLEQLLALAHGYNEDPRFKATFDRFHPELAAFILDAVEFYINQTQD